MALTFPVLCSVRKMKAVVCLSLSFFVVAIVGELITPKALTREIRADVLRGIYLSFLT